MARIIDLKVKIGSSASNMNLLPCAISVANPIISWQLPNDIYQKRFNVKISPVNNSGLYVHGQTLSSQTIYQYPEAYSLNSKFYGLCELEVAISERTSGEFEYTSGKLYFVYDDKLEILKVSDSYEFKWNNATDEEQSWNDLQYQLIVSSSVYFNDEDIIFNEHIGATSSNETSCIVNFNKKYDFIYWKVRAFDGIDYGDFTQVNAFKMTDNEIPIVEINNIEPLNDSNRDVKIDFSIIDSENDRLNLEVYYCGGTTGNRYKLASLINSVVSIKPGNYSIIWRSSLDEKKIKSSDYRIKITVIDDDGLYSEDTSDMFSMDNSTVGLEIGGNASIHNDYIVIGSMAIVKRSNIGYDAAPLYGKMKELGNKYREENTKLCCNIGSFKKYRTGNLNYKRSSPDPEKNNSQGSPDDFVWGNGSGGGEADIEPWYPVGMAIFQNRREDSSENGSSGGSGGGGSDNGVNDLDSGDPNFIRGLNVDADGNYRKMDERISYKSGSDLRWGFARFLTFFHACKDAICPKCAGKGWFGVELDKEADQRSRYKYKRKTCPTCLGNRFTEPNISPKEVGFTFNADVVKKDEPIILTGGKELIEKDFIATSDGETLDSSCYSIDCSKNSVTFLSRYNNVTIRYIMKKYEVKNTLYSISRWIPLEKYFSPLSRSELLHSCKIGDSKIINPIRGFMFGMTTPSSWYTSYSYGNSNSKSGYVFSPKELSEDTYYQVDCPTIFNKTYRIKGVYNGINFEGRSGRKIQNPLPENLNYRLEGYAHVEKLKLREHVSPINGKIVTGIENYISGTTYYDSVLSYGRKVPTHKWEPGIFIFEGNLHREQNLGSLKIVFLQSDWQVYNTIHWTAPSSASSLTQVQYCKINENGSNGAFHDVIAENSDYYEEQGAWFIPPQTWHCFWKTEDQISRNNNDSYRIRIRQYNLVSKTFTDWSYSDTTFSLKDSSTNPANIYYVEYKKFSKDLYIYFKLDDKDNEDFNIVSVSFSVDGGSWRNINKTDIGGDLFNLSSDKGQDGNGNKHLIVWDTSPYALKASDDYRIKIEVVKTKLVSGYSKPLLKWIKSPNTTSDIAERTIETYRGTWIRTYWDEEEKKAKALNPPIFQEGRIKDLEDKIFKIKCQNAPLPSTCDGYYTFLHDDAVQIEKDSDGNIISVNVLNEAVVNSVEIDGKTYFLNDWLNYKIDGVSRNSLIYNYSREISSCIEIVNSANNVVNESRNYVRRNLIDQGYYCNGFKNNTPQYIEDGSNSMSIDEGSYFKFKVLTYFDDSKNENGFYEPKYSEYLGNVLFTITKEDISGDGKTIVTKYDFHEYERTADVYSRIMMDKHPRYNSQNGKPLRDFIFIDGDRIATAVGGDNYNGATDSSLDKNRVDSTNASRYEVFTIPLEYLPGEQESDITSSDTFEGDYRWKVSSYNLLYGRPEEKPEFSATNTFDGNIVTLSVKTTAPIEMTDAKINEIHYVDKLFDKFLIEKDGSNSLSEYFDDSNSLYGNNIVSETVFVTDPPDEALSRGYCASFTWTPLSKHRTRPVVVVNDFNEKLFWYLKNNVYGEKVICMAKGKTMFRVGEYNMTIPSKNERLETEIDYAKNVFSHSVVYMNGLYLMYYIVDTDNGEIVKLSTSLDGNTWVYGDVNLPISNIYNLFALNNNGVIELYCCVYNESFNVYKLKSVDGYTFEEDGLYYSSSV